eukprot:978594-Pleurochrysis_carterae.AAC.1
MRKVGVPILDGAASGIAGFLAHIGRVRPAYQRLWSAELKTDAVADLSTVLIWRFTFSSATCVLSCEVVPQFLRVLDVDRGCGPASSLTASSKQPPRIPHPNQRSKIGRFYNSGIQLWLQTAVKSSTPKNE